VDLIDDKSSSSEGDNLKRSKTIDLKWQNNDMLSLKKTPSTRESN